MLLGDPNPLNHHSIANLASPISSRGAVPTGLKLATKQRPQRAFKGTYRSRFLVGAKSARRPALGWGQGLAANNNVKPSPPAAKRRRPRSEAEGSGGRKLSSADSSAKHTVSDGKNLSRQILRLSGLSSRAFFSRF